MKHEAALALIPEVLQEVLELPVEVDRLHTVQPHEADLRVQVGQHVFAIEYKANAGADQIGAGLRVLGRRHAEEGAVIPLLVVPHMGEVGKALCREEGVSWLDLSGNANITAPGLRMRIEGRPNRHKRPGRPMDLFAPRSSRIARVLLLQPGRCFSQSELAEETGLSWGTVSHLMRRYEEAGLVRREWEGRRASIQVADCDRLLDAWRQAYDFSTHEVRKGHISSRSGLELLQQMAQTFEGHSIAYAATGLAGAWLLEPFATFRLVTLYVSSWPSAEALAELRFHEEVRGSNVWLVRPKDEGVFKGEGTTEGVRHVSPVQIYLDLKAQPERSDEAAEELRRARLTWSQVNAEGPAV